MSLRIAVLDRDSGFLTVLGKRLERAGWEYRVLASSVAPETIVPMRLGAIVVDLAVIGPTCWEWLERLCGALPELGVVVCTGGSTVAQRVRGLRLGADDWLTKPCHPEELIARVESVVRRRRRLEASTAGEPLLAGEVEIHRDQYQAFVQRREHRPDPARVRADRAARRLGRAACSSASSSTSGCGATRWSAATARSTCSCASCARSSSACRPSWRYIHTHFGIGYRFAAEPRRRGRRPTAPGFTRESQSPATSSISRGRSRATS